MKKFTFIVDFRRGTYISQYIEQDIHTALRTWANSLDVTIYSQRIIKKIQTEVIWEQPSPIRGVDSVWCCTFSPYNSFLLLNIIETV